jgi:hypothetical protein
MHHIRRYGCITLAGVERLLEDALVQVRARRYPEAATARRVTLLAVAVADKEIGCRMEALDA